MFNMAAYSGTSKHKWDNNEKLYVCLKKFGFVYVCVRVCLHGLFLTVNDGLPPQHD